MQRQFTFHPSRYLAAMLITAHGSVCAALIPLTLPLWAKLALAFSVLFSLGYHLQRKAWLSAPSACVAMTLEGDQVALTMRDGARLDGPIARDSLVTPWLTVLNVLPQDARFVRSVVILPDSMDAESFRQLRVWLKWKY